MTKYKNIFLEILLLALVAVSVLSLLHSGLPFTHDGQDQVARIANFYQNLKEGNLIPVWAANLNWGYGHPILEFLYPLPSYLASFFHAAGLSLVDAAKVVFGLGMFLSAIFMYLWLSQFLDRSSAFIGAFLYTFAPYRFVDLYVRGDIGENLAFAFVPLVLYLMYKLYKKSEYKFIFLGTVSLALLILAHNAISLMFMPFILFYGAFLIFLSKNRREVIIHFLLLIILGFALSAFFWIPALIEGKYTLRNIVTAGQYVSRFVNLPSILYGAWNYGQTGQFTVQLGILQWLSFVASPFLAYFFYRQKKREYILIAGLILYTLAGIFLMFPLSGIFWQKLMLLQNLQFPWRFLAITVFTTAVLGAFAFSQIPNKYKALVLVVCVIFVLSVEKDYMKPKGYLYRPESFYTGVYPGTTDTGESSPVWSIRFMLHQPATPIKIIEGKGSVKELVDKSTYRLYDFNSISSARVLINILYFPSWTVYVDGKQVPVQFQDPQYRGLMTFTVIGGSHKIEAVFKNTKLRDISELLSAFSLIFLLGLGGFRFVKK